ncbi:hypothetical protein BJ742DRAFT_742981 [Cladochytrium replicatum]|nr:hypothetical protein BJ742DRAFT_742981 [Cladochytrium replicatum]
MIPYHCIINLSLTLGLSLLASLTVLSILSYSARIGWTASLPHEERWIQSWIALDAIAQSLEVPVTFIFSRLWISSLSDSKSILSTKITIILWLAGAVYLGMMHVNTGGAMSRSPVWIPGWAIAMLPVLSGSALRVWIKQTLQNWEDPFFLASVVNLLAGMLASLVALFVEETHGVDATFGGWTILAVAFGAAADAYGYELMGTLGQAPVCNAIGIFLASSVVADSLWNVIPGISDGKPGVAAQGPSIGIASIVAVLIILICGRCGAREEISSCDGGDKQMVLIHPSSMVSRKEYGGKVARGGSWTRKCAAIAVLVVCLWLATHVVRIKSKGEWNETKLNWRDILVHTDSREAKVPSDSSYRSKVDDRHGLIPEANSDQAVIGELAYLPKSVEAILGDNPGAINDRSQDLAQKASVSSVHQADLSIVPNKDESVSPEKSNDQLNEIEELKQSTLKQIQIQQQSQQPQVEQHAPEKQLPPWKFTGIVPSGSGDLLVPFYELRTVPPIVEFHRIDFKNVGDTFSSPFWYFPELSNNFEKYSIDVYSTKFTKALTGANSSLPVIVGGGGLIGCVKSWDQQLERLVNVSRNVIGWGIGFNTHSDLKYKGPADPNTFLDRFRLLGIRDVLPPYRFVPCSSCMHPAIRALQNKQPIREIGIFSHKQYPAKVTRVMTRHRKGVPVKDAPERLPVAILGSQWTINPDGSISKLVEVPMITGSDWKTNATVTTMLNSELDIVNVLEFLASAEVVITSSYHGLYWSTLLGKKVILTGAFSTKFDRFPWPPVWHTGDLDADIKNAKAYPEAFEQARTLTLEFWGEVKEILRENLLEYKI